MWFFKSSGGSKNGVPSAQLTVTEMKVKSPSHTPPSTDSRREKDFLHRRPRNINQKDND